MCYRYAERIPKNKGVWGGQVNGLDERKKTSSNGIKYQAEFKTLLTQDSLIGLPFYHSADCWTRTNMSITNVSWFDRLRLSFISPALPQMRLGPDESSQNPVMVSLAIPWSFTGRNRSPVPVLHMGSPTSQHELVEAFRKRAASSRRARDYTSMATSTKQSNEGQGRHFFAFRLARS